MKRSERLAREGKIEIYCGSVEIATVITSEQMSRQARYLRYLCTDSEALYDGREVSADVYEEKYSGELFAVVA